ncbi:HTH_48 domain-containing protein [Trichonephila clavipes]|uniref:HTH_48 domain-containing protein n=1 Tax=Trichonephila clavipes TaxID=2585209 RepID=A0A8X7BAV8_TRICX|nr:HTH_48 domain-containing protein [Trichonephila clavipes]
MLTQEAVSISPTDRRKRNFSQLTDFEKALIIVLRLEGDELDSVYGDSAPSFTTVKFWLTEFKRGRKSLGDDERSGRPNTATTVENIAQVHQMVLDDHRI